MPTQYEKNCQNLRFQKRKLMKQIEELTKTKKEIDRLEAELEAIETALIKLVPLSENWTASVIDCDPVSLA